jgi:hypothetical protein
LIIIVREMNTMGAKLKILTTVKYIGFTVLTLGIAIFLYGFFVSDYSSVTGIGIGTVMGAVFIFLMGVFFVATEEMHEKVNKELRLDP